MKKNQVNEILVNQAKRRNTVFSFVCLIIIVSLFTVFFFLISINKNKVEYVRYNESSDIDYNVYLKENEFFENNYVPENKEYIANLIDYIDADFKYKLSLDEEDIDYRYSYRIEAIVDVVRKSSGKSIFSKKQILLEEITKNTSSKSFEIKENLKIDYHKYNDLIRRFNTAYSLDDIESTLTVNMYVNVLGSCEENNDNKESVIALTIPLTTKTIGIDLSNNLVNSNNNVMKCDNNTFIATIFTVLGVIFAIADIVLITFTIRYEIKTRTAENIYEKELKKILNNYSSYIQKMNNDFNFKSYDLLKIDTFNDMLEIRDTIRQPILMRENIEKTCAYFVIPSNTKVLYVYRLNVNDIAKGIKKKS